MLENVYIKAYIFNERLFLNLPLVVTCDREVVLSIGPNK